MARTLFGKARYKKYKKIVEMDDIPSAKASVGKLRKEFREAGTRSKRRRIKWALVLAANRCGAMAENPQYSEETQEEKEKIGDIYEEGYEGMDFDMGTIHEKPMKELESHSHRKG